MKPKKLLSFLLATAMTISLLPTFTLTALADETPTTTTTEKNIALGTSALSGYDSTNNKYKYVYYGTYSNEAVKWRVLDMAYEYDTNDKSKTGMLVLSENALGKTAFGAKNTWNESTVQTWCNNMYNSSFGTGDVTKEKDFILGTTSTDNILSNDYLFFLSDDEASNNEYFPNDSNRIANLNGKAVWWWLRSPYFDFTYYANCVDANGDSNHYDVSRAIPATRPAFNLNLSSVLFTTPAENGKKTNNVGTLFANVENTDNEYKLTMKDSKREFAVTEKKITVPKGGSATISYENAKTGPNEYISAMLLNEDKEVLYYGQIKNVTSSSEAGGKATVEIPASVNTGTYTLRVFNEQINGDKKTDFSSDFSDITLNVVTEKNITLGTSALSGYDSTNNKYRYVYYGAYNDEAVKWRVLDMAYEYDTNDKSKTGMLVLSENALDKTAFGKNNTWNKSTVKTWCNDMYNSSFGTDEGTKEQDFILGTTSTDDILRNGYLFFLSRDEANNTKYFPNDDNRVANLNGNAVWWWLRSPYGDNYVYYVNEIGSILGFRVDFDYPAARPAFNLNPASVLFTSAALGGKSGNVGTLSANAENAGNEYKLTMKDSTRSEFTAKATDVSENILTVSYINAKAGTNEYISAIIVNADGDVTYYGKLANVKNESGTATLDLTGVTLASTDKVYIFNEQINGDYKTDFASELKEIAIKTNITLTKDKVSAYLVGNSATLIVASYKDKALKDVKTITLTSNIYEKNLAEIGLDTNGADSIKAFLWTDMENLTPLCEEQEVILNQSVS